MALSICRTNLSDVPINDENKILHKLSHTGTNIGNRKSFQNHLIFWMLIAQDTCSNENKISVYV